MSNVDALTQALREGRLALAEVAGITSRELDAIYETAAMRLDLGRADEAVRMLGALVVLYPFGAEYWRAYSIALNALGDEAAALRAHAMAESIEPTPPPPEPTVTNASAEPTETNYKSELTQPSADDARLVAMGTQVTSPTETMGAPPKPVAPREPILPPESTAPTATMAPRAPKAPAPYVRQGPIIDKFERPEGTQPTATIVRPEKLEPRRTVTMPKATWPSDEPDEIERPAKRRRPDTAIIDVYRLRDSEEDARIERRMRTRAAAGFDPNDKEHTAIIRRRAGLPLGDA